MRVNVKLFLVRHGIAVDRIGSDIRSDFDRYLTPEGFKECEQVAAGLARLGVKPEIFITSPLVRAKQTADVFSAGLTKSSSPRLEICRALAPGGKFSEILAAVPKDVEQVMFFGHEPDMSNFAQHLLASDVEIPFKKSAVCRIDVDKIPPEDAGVLKWFITPKLGRLLKD